jgi:pimeloyl-ACP methyl ester carboxylesterase
MKRVVSILGLALFTFALFIQTPAQTEAIEEVAGIWQGVLKVPGAELRIVFKITKKPDNTLTAVLDSPDQGVSDIPVTNVTYRDSKLVLEAVSIGGVYEGNVKTGGKEIEGVWKQGGGSFPLILQRTDKVLKLKRPQEPKKPYPYREEEVAYQIDKAGIKLAGTLTLPPSQGPFPAVLLISGSGAQDRDETVFGHRPFLVLADYLTRRGIAVLRVDDRGVGGSTGKDTQPTTKDLANDVLAGVRFLEARKEINPRMIGLIGHSEGGIIAPIVASQSKDIAFIVMMAGTGLPGDEVLYRQSELISRAEGESEAKISKNLKIQHKIFTLLKQESADGAAEKKIRALLEDSISKLSEEEKKQIGDPETYINSLIKQVCSPWMRFFLKFDPRTVLVKVKCPVLAIIGEKDLQVSAQENLKAIEQALKDGGNKYYTVKELPGLNHLFQESPTGSPLEYSRIEETMSPKVLKLVGDWILKQTENKVNTGSNH